MAVYNNPIVLQRADPWVLKVDGEYYFTGSDPEYNCIAIRHASNINDLQKAPETVVWRKHESGPASIYIWAPELHRINGAWYIYFAGAATDFEASGLPTHRMFVLENTDDDPTTDNWVEKGQIVTPIDSFALDATTEVIDGVLIDTGGDSIDTTMVQRPLPDGGLRTYRITKDNSFGNGIWMDYTDARRWWESDTQWHVIQRHIGANYVEDGNPGGVEGPAVFANHHNNGGPDDEWYLFVDVIPSIGYKPMSTKDLDAGWHPLNAADYFLSPHTKHGGVASLTREEYERLIQVL